MAKGTSTIPARQRRQSKRGGKRQASAAQAPASGRYAPVAPGSVPGGAGVITSERLALDVDGHFPQMAVSGTVRSGITRSVQWIARLAADGPRSFVGPVFYKLGDTEIFPFSSVAVEILPAASGPGTRLLATFTGDGLSRSREFRRTAKSFHAVHFEFDAVTEVTPVMSISTAAHPNRPSDLRSETLSIQKVFQRAGFRVSTSSQGGIVPISGAGADLRWSDLEMHDAMQANWSRFSDQAQWALWVFYAALHVEGNSLGGIMFDEFGARHRQGTAIFCNSFIADVPASDPAPQAYRDRTQFWTACHEMGHAFNLAHSWDKGEPESWIPLVSRPESRSFMNYPDEVQGGEQQFYQSFHYRFDDDELLFLRHAPAGFVQMGNAHWFDNHAFQNADLPEKPTFRLELRHHRAVSTLEFLEPMMIELKLTNLARTAQTIPAFVLSDPSLVLIVKPDGKPARRRIPFARYCREPAFVKLGPGKSLYELVFAGADATGWPACEPGKYTVQALVVVNGTEVVSGPLRINIAPPQSFEEERFGQDYFSPEVGRVLAFDGSNYLAQANATLEELVRNEGLSARRASVHAQVALGLARMKSQKLLSPPSRAGAAPRVTRVRSKPEEARKRLDDALEKNPPLAAETLGHIDFNYYTRVYAEWLAAEGERRKAENVIASAVKTLRRRKVIPAAITQLRGALKRT